MPGTLRRKPPADLGDGPGGRCRMRRRVRRPDPGIESTMRFDEDKRREPNGGDRESSADGDGEQERAKDERDGTRERERGIDSGQRATGESRGESLRKDERVACSAGARRGRGKTRGNIASNRVQVHRRGSAYGRVSCAYQSAGAEYGPQARRRRRKPGTAPGARRWLPPYGAKPPHAGPGKRRASGCAGGWRVALSGSARKGGSTRLDVPTSVERTREREARRREGEARWRIRRSEEGEESEREESAGGIGIARKRQG